MCITCCLACIVWTGLLFYQGHSRRGLLRAVRRVQCAWGLKFFRGKGLNIFCRRHWKRKSPISDLCAMLPLLTCSKQQCSPTIGNAIMILHFWTDGRTKKASEDGSEIHREAFYGQWIPYRGKLLWNPLAAHTTGIELSVYGVWYRTTPTSACSGSAVSSRSAVSCTRTSASAVGDLREKTSLPLLNWHQFCIAKHWGICQVERHDTLAHCNSICSGPKAVNCWRNNSIGLAWALHGIMFVYGLFQITLSLP